MAKIAIDCRYYGNSGIGRYLSGILEQIDYEADEIFLIGNKNILDTIPYKFKPIYCVYSPFSIVGLFKFPIKEINKCDCFYSPNFILPYGIKIKIYTTIHDVVFLDFSDSNKNKFDYYIKKFFLRRAIKKSKLIFTVSKFTKSRICKHFKNTKDIVVTGNAIANTLKQYKPCTEKREKTLIYVGNIKKHKGLKVLFNALDILNSNVGGYKLVIAGSKDNFRTSDNSVFEYFDRDDVRFTGYLNDEELVREISSATFLIQPSFYEGFGLAPLEALYYSTKPIISDIEVFSEVYSQFDDVVFFESNNPDSLAQKIIDSNPDVLISQKKIDSIFNYKNFTDIIFNELRGVKN